MESMSFNATKNAELNSIHGVNACLLTFFLRSLMHMLETKLQIFMHFIYANGVLISYFK